MDATATLTGLGITLGSVSGGGNNLTTSDSGTTILGGSLTNLGTLSVTATGIHINGGSVTTTGAQTYHNAVTLGADTTLTGTAIDFVSTINSDLTPKSLTTNGSGTLTLGGAIGGTHPLSILTLDVPGITTGTAIAASQLLFDGTGTFSLTNSGNAIGTIAAAITGA